MNNEKYYNDRFVKSSILEIVREMHFDDFKPDYIAGLKRGGLVPGVMLSHYLKVPFYSIGTDESNLWMAEEAFGCVDEEQRGTINSRWDISFRKNILIIDDINDTGNTFKHIINDWQSGCFPKEQSVWNTVWHKNVKFAALIENDNSDFFTDYAGHHINKAEQPEWCVFPWERWW